MKRTTQNAVTFYLIWIVLLIGSALLSLAIAEHKRVESERMQRVHTQGMAIGATLCGRSV